MQPSFFGACTPAKHTGQSVERRAGGSGGGGGGGGSSAGGGGPSRVPSVTKLRYYNAQSSRKAAAAAQARPQPPDAHRPNRRCCRPHLRRSKRWKCVRKLHSCCRAAQRERAAVCLLARRGAWSALPLAVSVIRMIRCVINSRKTCCVHNAANAHGRPSIGLIAACMYSRDQPIHQGCSSQRQGWRGARPVTCRGLGRPLRPGSLLDECCSARGEHQGAGRS